MKGKKELNSRQWKTYEYLKKQADYVSLKKIVEDLKENYDYKENPHVPFNNTAARRILTEDLQAIKENPTIQKVLLTSPAGIKLAATREEAKLYFEKEEMRLAKEWKRLWISKRKALQDGQTYMVFNSERGIIEAFNKVMTDCTRQQ